MMLLFGVVLRLVYMVRFWPFPDKMNMAAGNLEISAPRFKMAVFL